MLLNVVFDVLGVHVVENGTEGRVEQTGVTQQLADPSCVTCLLIASLYGSGTLLKGTMAMPEHLPGLCLHWVSNQESLASQPCPQQAELPPPLGGTKCEQTTLSNYSSPAAAYIFS